MKIFLNTLTPEKMYHIQHYLPDNSDCGSNPWAYHDYCAPGDYNRPASSGGIRITNDGVGSTYYVDFYLEARGHTELYAHNFVFFRLGELTAVKESGILNGSWHNIEMRFVNNSEMDATDGLIEFWLNGTKISAHPSYPATGIDWNNTLDGPNTEMRGFRHFSIGGNNTPFLPGGTACTETMEGCERWYAFDDVVVSTEYVGPEYTINDSDPVVFQDNFDGHTTRWDPSGTTGALFPWTTDETFDATTPVSESNDGGGIYITNYEPSSYAEAERTNANSWNGWVENPTSTGNISIETTGGVDNSPALRIRLVKYPGLSSETGLNKWLGNTHYQEIYLQYKVKFGSTAGDFWWGGSWTNGDPTGGEGIIWKLGRAWTGFNPTDYDKTGGQSQPVENTTWSDESNWRTGIWIPGIIANPYSLVDNTVAFIISDFHWEPSCPDGVGGTCDSQNNPRDTDGYRDWIRYTDNLVPTSSYGMVHNFANSGNPLNTSTGAFTENQQFHTIEMRFKNRTNPSTPDGAYQVWIDGTEITDDCVGMTDNLVLASMISDADDYGINFIRFVDNFNKLTEDIPDDPGYMDLFIDDIIISTEYIGTANTAPNSTIDTPTEDTTITAGETVNFTGTGTDADGDDMTYLWNFDGGASNSTSADPGNVQFNTAGVYDVVFTVTDEFSLADPTPDTVTITVEEVEEPPVTPMAVIKGGRCIGCQ